MPPRFIARQLARPTGLAGRIVGHLMNRHNARMNAFAVRQLGLLRSERVLEIGFGGGAALPALLGAAGFVAGIDRSPAMVEVARRRHAAAVASGRAEFHEAHVEAIPYGRGAFAKACTVNTVYFWPSLEAGFIEIHRVLGPDGRLVVGFLPKEWMDRKSFPSDIFTSRAPADVMAALTRAGFRDVRVERPEPSTRWNVVVATR